MPGDRRCPGGAFAECRQRVGKAEQPIGHLAPSLGIRQSDVGRLLRSVIGNQLDKIEDIIERGFNPLYACIFRCGSLEV